ncbi:MAG: hypothetical protein OXD29_07785 [Roseovarius sp.]|nr:hypothetical protein [Roseovarius sp.]
MPHAEQAIQPIIRVLRTGSNIPHPEIPAIIFHADHTLQYFQARPAISRAGHAIGMPVRLARDGTLGCMKTSCMTGAALVSARGGDAQFPCAPPIALRQPAFGHPWPEFSASNVQRVACPGVLLYLGMECSSSCNYMRVERPFILIPGLK